MGMGKRQIKLSEVEVKELHQGEQKTRPAVSHNHIRKDFPALVRAFSHHLGQTLFRFV